MGKSFLVNLVAIMFIAAIAYSTVVYVDNDRREYEERRLASVIDNATEGALTTLLINGNLTSDYNQLSDLNIDPYIALESFTSTILRSYGLPDTLENRMGLKLDNIPVFAVTVGDGYYIAKIQEAKKTTDGTKRFDLVFSPKKPYTYVLKDSTTGKTYQYALALDGDYHYAISGDNPALGSMPYDARYVKGTAPGLDSLKTNLKITEIVTSDIKSIIDSYMETSNMGWVSNFYLPVEVSEMAYKETNLIEGPSVIALVQNLNFGFKQSIDNVSVAGNKLNLKRAIVGYMRNGIKYYTFSDKLPAGTTISKTFDSMQEAAKDGFTPDIRTME